MRHTSKKFLFLRHGESLWNAKNLCQGQTDIELSEKGIREAEIFAEKFASFSVGHICTSPLKRAFKTAEIVKQYHPQAGFTVIKEFSERNYGCLEGISTESMYEVAKLEEKDLDHEIDPSIESRQALRARITQGLEIAFQLHDEPLIVSHGRLFVSLCEVLGLPNIGRMKNLGFMEITQTSGQWRLREI